MALPELTISGLLVDERGVAVGDEPLVLAWPVGLPPVDMAVVAALAGRESALLAARVAPDGRFQITGVVANLSYTLMAGGNGVLADPVAPVPAGTTDAVVVARALFGLRLRFPGAEDARSIWLSPGPQWTWDEAGEEVTGVGGQVSSLLAGRTLQEISRVTGPSVSLLFCGPADRTEIGPVRFSGTLVGCEPFDEELWIPRLHKSCEERILVPRPLLSEYGKIRVDFVGHPSSPPVERIRPFGEVHFNSLDGGCSFSQLIADFRPFDLTHLPLGSYSITLSTEAGLSALAAREGTTRIRADELATTTFDLASTASLEIRVLLHDGTEHGGQASFRVEHVSGDGSNHAFASFRRPPYRVDGLIAGTYCVRIDLPFRLREPLTVELEGGRAASVTFREP